MIRRPTVPSFRTFAVGLVAAGSIAAALQGGEPHHGSDVPAHRHLGEVTSGSLGVLPPNQPIYWETPFIACDGDRERAPYAPRECASGTGGEWTLWLAQPAELLRIDWDQPYVLDHAELQVVTPAGETFTTERFEYGDLSNGVWIEDAPAGTYQVALRVRATDGATFRLRAGVLDGLPERGDGALLPNLRVYPPFEFGFAAPLNPVAGPTVTGVLTTYQGTNPSARLAGQNLQSCTLDEQQEALDPTVTDEPRLVTRCLRFTTGPLNVGDGEFDVRFPILDRAVDDRDRLVEMTQFIHHGDGTLTERPAGTYEFHPTHMHFHYAEVLHYELLAVADDGSLVAAGLGNKSGFCPADMGYGDWWTFDQDPKETRYASGTQCLTFRSESEPEEFGNGAMGLSAGWADVYLSQFPGQYVDFTGRPDGTYVVRVTVDAAGVVLESDETDNTSYALIEVAGDEVTILERGQGSSHRDPNKVPVHDNRANNVFPGLDER